jgi:Tol biopolymer transport system component
MGGTPRQLTDVGSDARVSPDGSQTAFLRGMWDDEQIWLMQADGNNVRKLVDGGDERFGPAAWSPDGKRFAYLKVGHNPNQIDVYDVATGHSETIMSDPRLGREMEWVKSERLIYSLHEAQPNENYCNLWSVRLDDLTGRPSGLPVRITNDRTDTARISVTSDGKHMAVLRGTHHGDVYLAELEAKGERLGPLRRLTLDDRYDVPFAWTPDSKAVLFISNRDGPNHIFKQNIDEAQPELLIGGKGIAGHVPRVSPDGASVLYYATGNPADPSDDGRIMRVPLAGGASQPVLGGPGFTGYWCTPAQPRRFFCQSSRSRRSPTTDATATPICAPRQPGIAVYRSCTVQAKYIVGGGSRLPAD